MLKSKRPHHTEGSSHDLSVYTCVVRSFESASHHHLHEDVLESIVQKGVAPSFLPPKTAFRSSFDFQTSHFRLLRDLTRFVVSGFDCLHRPLERAPWISALNDTYAHSSHLQLSTQPENVRSIHQSRTWFARNGLVYLSARLATIYDSMSTSHLGQERQSLVDAARDSCRKCNCAFQSF